jgi:hypothetical protein
LCAIGALQLVELFGSLGVHHAEQRDSTDKHE